MRLIALLAALAVTSLSAQQTAPASRDPAAPAQVGTASLSGIVVILGGPAETPLRRARVIVQSDATPAQIVDTDTSGRFHVSGLAAGSFHVTVDKPGFVPAARLAPITIAADHAATINITMEHAAALEGRLTTEDGEAAAGFTVSAVRVGYGPYGKRPIAVRQTITDDLGRFRIHTLPAGQYFIDAILDPNRAMNTPIDAGLPQPAHTFYPGTARLNDARVVVATTGQDTGNLDFVLTTAVVVNVMGHVTMSSGQKPADWFGVRLQRVGAPPGEVRCSQVPQDNHFRCGNVPPGDYSLLVCARASATGDAECAAAPVTVSGESIPDIAVVTSPGVPQSGRVEVEGGLPIPAGLQIEAIETGFESPLPNPAVPGVVAVPPAKVGADGTFMFPLTFGTRLLRPLHLPDGWAVARVLLGDTDITDLPTTFVRSEPSPIVRIIVTPRTGAVGGVITDAATHAAGGACVVVFSSDQARWGARSRFIKTIEAGSDARYAIGGLLPGQYFVVAVDTMDDGAWEDPDVLARLRQFAAPLVVGGTDTQVLNLNRVVHL